jgi:hypothetical protein
MVDSYEIAIMEPDCFLGLYWLRDLRAHNLDPKQSSPRPTWKGTGASN